MRAAAMNAVTADVVIVGAGIMGVSIAYHLARRRLPGLHGAGQRRHPPPVHPPAAGA
jgi:cation diffusion facilitator CzcD-associated flavoprotein CzcO